MGRIDLEKVRMQFISHFTDRYSYLDSIRMALDGGCRWVQLRMKGATDDDVLRIAPEVKRLCEPYGATFILDDRVHLVAPTGADGVHLGKKDMPIREARRLLGEDCIIGGTANTFSDVQQHRASSADYIGYGPFRFTTTKQGLAPVLGLEGYRRVVSQMREAGIDLPIVAIGGITAGDIPDILQTGVTGIALSGSVLRADDPVAEMQRLLEILRKELRS